MTGKVVKISTVTAESMIPLPGVAGPRPQPKRKPPVEKSKDDQAAKLHPQFIYHQIKRTSMSVILSILYAKILITACIAIVISQEITHELANVYYEGFFIYVFTMAIFFNFVMLCFFLRYWSCCAADECKKEKRNGEGKAKEPVSAIGRKRSSNPATREVYPRKVKDMIKLAEHKQDEDGLDEMNNEVTEKDCCGQGKSDTSRAKRMLGGVNTQERLVEPSPENEDVENGHSRTKKTTQNLHHHGSFYMRLCTIGLGLVAMIYCGLQFRIIVDTQILLRCYQNLQGINTLLYMAFIFFQMYFIFLHTRVNILCYKIFARFGLMHILATNICVWIRTAVFECMKRLNSYNVTTNSSLKVLDMLVEEYTEYSGQSRKLRDSTTSTGVPPFSSYLFPTIGDQIDQFVTSVNESMTDVISRNFTAITTELSDIITTTETARTLLTSASTTAGYAASTFVSDAIASFQNPLSNDNLTTIFATSATTGAPPLTTTTTTPPASLFTINDVDDIATKTVEIFNDSIDYLADMASSSALKMDVKNYTIDGGESCDDLNILKDIVEGAAPYLYPFAIEYSLIGAAVMFVIWRHVGRYQRYVSEENIERKLETMLSQRAVALAQAQNGARMDCIGSSKGLFFGLLMFVGSVICMILYFVLVLHPQMKSMAIHLADVSQIFIMVLSILAILIGFIRAKKLKFYPLDSSELNDLLLAISSIGVFAYSTFGIIAGWNQAGSSKKHLFVVINGGVALVQVVMQFIYINDMSKRHVYLPEHDRNKPGRQLVTFLIICNFTMWMLFVFESRKVFANPIQLEFYGFVAWTVLEHITLPLCMFHRLYAAITLVEIWKNSYKQRIE